MPLRPLWGGARGDGSTAVLCNGAAFCNDLRVARQGRPTKYQGDVKLARKLTAALVLGIFAVLLVQSITRVRREMGMFENDMRREGRTMGRVLATAATEVWTTDG